MDQCRNCIARGDMDKCLSVACVIRDTWFAGAIMARNAELKIEIERLKATALTACDLAIEKLYEGDIR